MHASQSPDAPADLAAPALLRLQAQGWWQAVRLALEPAWYAHRRTLPQNVVSSLRVSAGMCRHTTAVCLDLCEALELPVGVANGRCGSHTYPALQREHTWLITRTLLLDLTADQFGGPPIVLTTWRTPEFRTRREVTVGPLVYLARNADPDPREDMEALRQEGALDWLPASDRSRLLDRAASILARGH